MSPPHPTPPAIVVICFPHDNILAGGRWNLSVVLVSVFMIAKDVEHLLFAHILDRQSIDFIYKSHPWGWRDYSVVKSAILFFQMSWVPEYPHLVGPLLPHRHRTQNNKNEFADYASMLMSS